jgi:hypothetical protein
LSTTERWSSRFRARVATTADASASVVNAYSSLRSSTLKSTDH